MAPNMDCAVSTEMEGGACFVGHGGSRQREIEKIEDENYKKADASEYRTMEGDTSQKATWCREDRLGINRCLSIMDRTLGEDILLP